MHPLVHDLDKLKDSEVESRIFDLTKRYFSTINPDLRQQISLLLDTYKEELKMRRQREYQKMVETRNKDLDKLINVN